MRYDAAVRAALAIVISLGQLALWALLAAASAHLLRLARWGWGRPLASDAPPALADFPVVTVQLPIRNERYVAERVLRAACALDWPRDRLEVQALDDSDDDTRAIVDRVAAELRAAGHDVKVIRRESRAGFKAGNLAHGLATARGEFIAVLDADSVPPRDLLARLVPPLLGDASLGFSQARWSFENEARSLVTRVQALILDGLMLIEQPRLSALARPLQFNGSGGVWRRSALEAAGGWLGPSSSASVTEDLDLSYRAQLAGFRGRQLAEAAVETELPSTMAAFRAQQARWVRGAGQVLRSLARRIARPPAGVSGRDRVAMAAHLLRHARQPLLVALVAWLPLTALGVIRPLVDWPWAWPAILALVWLSVGAYYGAAFTRLGRAPGAAFVLAPVVMALSLGLSLELSAALLSRRSEWARTPKSGPSQSGAPLAAARDAGYRAPRSGWTLIELALALGYAACAALAMARGDALPAAGLAAVAASFAWVGLASLSN